MVGSWWIKELGLEHGILYYGAATAKVTEVTKPRKQR